jgi:hypothetical protein
VVRVPKYVFLGQVAYVSTWWLRKNSGEAAEDVRP